MKNEKIFTINKLLLIIAICFIGCGSSDDSPSQEQQQEQEEEVTIEGDYIGTWNSTTPTATFTNVGVSARLAFQGTNTNRLIGGFFISTNFSVCCSSGSNDGTLTIDFDGTSITSFRYNDVITNCSGTFVGNGTIRADGALVIDFTGSDCDGNHVGQIILKK
ncbi:MAG: hypothetical protein IMY67_07640 [Bacteroidetes bacterium]|nr:hypothetical protein [Bacteroidota bacterium]